MTRVITEAQALRDLRHLANEVYPLLVPKGIGLGATEAERQAALHQHQADRRLAAELAETAWRKLREAGPVFDGFSGYIRALENGQAEWLTYRGEYLHYRWTCNLLRPEIGSDLSIWGILQVAEYCPEADYARVRARCQTDLHQLRERALTRWYKAEQELLAEGVLPVRLLAPSAVGGARYVVDKLVPDYLEAALRETLACWGGFIVRRWRSIGIHGKVYPSHWYTLSLELADDQWHIAQQMVLQYYADLKGARDA